MIAELDFCKISLKYNHKIIYKNDLAKILIVDCVRSVAFQ